MLISSQLPVGSTRRLEQRFRSSAGSRVVGFGCSPENLRLGKAIDVFTHPDRVVVGVRSNGDRERMAQLLRPFTERIEWMSVESAEMTKHALNAFLATSVTFINEIAALCEQVGADAAEVERALKSESRIGPKAYLSPGGAFAGGTLARDVVFLSQLGQAHGVQTNLLSSIKPSNDAHRRWAQHRLQQLLGGVSGKAVAIWGLTYKPGTDTLRRSSSVELCNWLLNGGATVRAHDPAIRVRPPDLVEGIALADTAARRRRSKAPRRSCFSTPWPEYRQRSPPNDVAARMKRPLVLDANRFTQETLGSDPRIEYVSVGALSAHDRPQHDRWTGETLSSRAPIKDSVWRSRERTSKPGPACSCAPATRRCLNARAAKWRRSRPAANECWRREPTCRSETDVDALAGVGGPGRVPECARARQQRRRLWTSGID